MLVQAVVIVSIFSNVVSSTIPQELFAVTNIKHSVHELTKHLDDFKKHMTAKIRDLENSLWENRKENEPPEEHMNRTFCLQKEIPQARMEAKKLLNMLVEGETNQLAIEESSLINMRLPTDEPSVQELHRLWGSLGARGESRRKVDAETANFESMAKSRFEEVRKRCIGRKNQNDTLVITRS